MDPSGLNMSVVGITTVFLALTMLMGIVSALASYLNKTPPAPAAAAPSQNAPAEAAPSGPDPRLRSVAMAAFTYHHHVTRRRRFAPIAVAAAATPWRQAGRAEQLGTRFPRG